MITPKEKAEELVGKYSSFLPPEEMQFELVIAKGCAIIAVQEILKLDCGNGKTWDYWQEVLEHIKLM